MSSRRARLLLATALAAAPALTLPGAVPAMAQDRGVIALLDQANYWRLQGRQDQVVRTLGRLLAADPNNVEALAGLAEAHAQLGNRAEAEAMLARLRQLAPSEPRTLEADMAVRGATVDAELLAEARRLAQAGRAAEAVRRYRELFRGAGVPDGFALEYYQALAGTEGGWAEAREGLERLAARSSGSSAAQLAYARVLTYREGTRAQGIERLRELSRNPTTAQAATAAWRQALNWYGAGPGAITQLEAYLQAFPNDAEMERRLAEARNPPTTATDQASQRAWEALNANRLRDAEREFQDLLAQNPNDTDGLSGLGILRLRQGRSAEARTLIERAIAADPSRRTSLQQALDGASYSAEVAQARRLLSGGQVDEAEQVLRRAVRRSAADRSDAEALLGDVAMRRGDAAGAEQRYRAALARRPDMRQALAGLYESLQSQGRFAEAEEILRRRGFDPASGTLVGDAARARAEALRAEASRTQDPEAASALLRSALASDPADPWARLDLARLLARHGRADEARALMQEPLASGQGTPDQLYAAALFADEDGRTADAVQLIERVPVRLRTADMTRLVARARVLAEVRAATAQVALGRQEEARQRLSPSLRGRIRRGRRRSRWCAPSWASTIHAPLRMRPGRPRSRTGRPRRRRTSRWRRPCSKPGSRGTRPSSRARSRPTGASRRRSAGRSCRSSPALRFASPIA